MYEKREMAWKQRFRVRDTLASLSGLEVYEMWERETESLFERGMRETLSSQKNQVKGKARMCFREPFEYKDNSAHRRPVERGSWDWVSLGVVQSSVRWASSQSQITRRHRCVTFPDHLIPWSLSGFCGEWVEYMHPTPHREMWKLNESAGKYLYAQTHEAWQRIKYGHPRHPVQNSLTQMLLQNKVPS